MGVPWQYLDYQLQISRWAADQAPHIPDERQVEFLDCRRPDIILNWARQVGKTEWAAVKIAHRALFHPRSLCLVVSATQRQAGILQHRLTSCLREMERREWRKIKEVEVPGDALDENSQLIKCSVLSLELANGSEVVSIPASEDTVRGYSPDVIVIDEAARVRDGVHDAIRPMRAAKQVQLILMSTPNGRRGFFYREWTGDDPEWWRSAYPANECPRVSAKYLERERTKFLTEAMWRQEYFLEFANPAGSIFTPQQIQSMIYKDVDETAPIKPWSHNIVVEGAGYR